jgi:hypothetical protein
MKLILKSLSLLGLALTILPAFLVFLNLLSWSLHSDLMTVGMIVWFVSAPVWMRSSRR